jgi:hypothetical protein
MGSQPRPWNFHHTPLLFINNDMSVFNIFPSDTTAATMSLPPPFHPNSPSYMRDGSFHPKSVIAAEARPVLEAAIRAVTADWPADEVEKEVARHLGAEKWINIVVGRSTVFSVTQTGPMETTAPTPSSVKTLLSHDKVRLWHLVGNAEVYAERVGVFPRGVSLKASQTVVEYPACLDYAFAKK